MVAALQQLHEPGTVESTLRAAVAERIGEARFGLWFGEGVRLGVDDDALQVGVPNAFFREWIQAHFAGNLIEAAEAVTGAPCGWRSGSSTRPSRTSAT
jgi:chromosomal replication initiator protein